MRDQNDKSIYKQLLHIVAPISFQYLMASFVSASDAFMLGFWIRILWRHLPWQHRSRLYTACFTGRSYSALMFWLPSIGAREIKNL